MPANGECLSGRLERILLTEEWRAIPGYEGYYEVSNFGNVRALDREVVRSDGVKQHKSGGSVQLRANHDGYLQCRLSRDGQRSQFGVHQLVAMAFVPNPDNLPEINHLDAVRDNNHVDNLEWCTHGDNVRYAIQLGHHVCTTDLCGANNPNFGNHKLHERLSADPLLAQQWYARPASQNGRASKITCVDRDGTQKEFDWIGACAEYLRSQGYTSAAIDSIRSNIGAAKRIGKTYLKCKFI